MAVLAPLLAGCATAEFGDASNSVTAINLMPRSAVTIWAWGACASIENKLPKPHVIYFPVFFSSAWHGFLASEHGRHIKVTPCT